MLDERNGFCNTCVTASRVPSGDEGVEWPEKELSKNRVLELTFMMRIQPLIYNVAENETKKTKQKTRKKELQSRVKPARQLSKRKKKKVLIRATVKTRSMR